mgnify:CR=1 FL=1
MRWTAIGGTALVGVGAAVAIGANPYPHPERPKAPDVQALEAREQALATEARRVNAMNTQRWAVYRQELAQRQEEIAAINAANASARASAAASAATAGSSSSGSYGGSSYSAPSASYVPAPPVASSGAS